MAETLDTVRTEFLARGFDYLAPSGVYTRANRLINDAYKWLVRRYLWPFREATSSGASPLTIADLGAVGSVTDTANGNRKLHYRDRRTLVECYGDLTVAGSPEWFYIEGGTVVKTYPAGGTLSVRYWKNAVTLSGASDPLIVPDDWIQVVIDRACYRAYLDADNADMARLMRAEVDAALEDMVVDQLANQASDPNEVVIYGGNG